CDESQIIENQQSAEFMAVKPHQELVQQIKKKNPIGNKKCNAQGNGIQNNISIQKIFLFQETLKPCPKRFDEMVFFHIIKLIDNSSCKNTEYSTENNPVNPEIKYKLTQIFFLIEQKKSGNIQCKSEE